MYKISLLNLKYFTFFFISFFLNLFIVLFFSVDDGLETLLSPYSVEILDCNDVQKSLSCRSLMWNTVSTPVDDSIKFLGGSDAGSYMRGGLIIAGTPHILDSNLIGSFSERFHLMNSHGYGLWPPGMFLLNGALLSFDSGLEIGFLQLITAALIWAFVFSVFIFFLSKKMHFFYSVMLLMLVHLYPVMGLYMFKYGVQLTETYSSSLMMISFIGLLNLFVDKSKNISYLLFGLALGLGVLFRAQLYLFLILITMALFYFMYMRSVDIFSVRRDNVFFFIFGSWFPVLIYMIFNGGALFRADYNFWNPFLNQPADFLVNGGVLVACQVDAELCKIMNGMVNDGTINGAAAKAALIRAFLFNPLDFILLKLPFFLDFWFEVNSGPYYHQNIIISIIGLSSICYIIYSKMWVHLVFTTILLVVMVGPPFLLHFESRYFYLLKVYFIFLPYLIVITSDRFKSKLS